MNNLDVINSLLDYLHDQYEIYKLSTLDEGSVVYFEDKFYRIAFEGKDLIHLHESNILDWIPSRLSRVIKGQI